MFGREGRGMDGGAWDFGDPGAILGPDQQRAPGQPRVPALVGAPNSLQFPLKETGCFGVRTKSWSFIW